MTIPTKLSELSTSIAANSPASTDAVTEGDDNIRTAFALLRQVVTAGSDIASASSISLPAGSAGIASANLTGTTTVTAISSTDSWDGRVFMFRHAGAHTFTHSSTLFFPDAASHTFASGDISWWRQRTSGTWDCVGILQAALVATFGNVNVTASAVPANGLYLPSANTIGLSANSTQVATSTSTAISLKKATDVVGDFSVATNKFTVSSSTGAVVIGAPSSGTALQVTQVAGTTAGISLLGNGAEARFTMTDGGAGNRVWTMRSGGFAVGTFDVADLTAGQSRLRIDSSGQMIVPAQPSFMAYSSAARTTAGTYATFTEAYDTASNFNNTTGTFTCPVAGRYLVEASVSGNNATVAGFVDFKVLQNGAGAWPSHTVTINNSTQCGSYTLILNCAVSDTITVSQVTQGGTGTTGTCTLFSVHLLG